MGGAGEINVWIYNRTAVRIEEALDHSGEGLSSVSSNQQSVCLKMICLQS